MYPFTILITKKERRNVMRILKKWCIVFVIVNIAQLSFNTLYVAGAKIPRRTIRPNSSSQRSVNKFYAEKCEDHLITDKTTGCQVFTRGNVCLLPNESIIWSGQCQQVEALGLLAQGKGQLRVYQNNELTRIYFGEMGSGRFGALFVESSNEIQLQQYQHGELQIILSGKMIENNWFGDVQAYQFQNGALVSYAIEHYNKGIIDGKMEIGHFVKQPDEYQWFENGQLVKTSTSDEQNTPTPLPVQPTIPPTKNPPSPVQPIKPRTQQPIKSHCDRVCSGESGLFGAAEALERKDCGCPFDKFTTCRAILLDCTSKCAGLNILPGPKDTTCEPKCQKNFEDCMK